MISKIPIELSDEQINEYRRIYKKNFGEDVSKDEAINQGLRLVRLIALVIDTSGKNV